MELIITIATWLLRAVGLLWLFGGIAVIVQVRRLQPLEDALDQLETMAAELPDDPDDPDDDKALDEQADDDDLGEPIADPGRNRWMIAGGVLTAVTGVGLLLAARWVMVPLTLLLAHQVLYVRRQDHKVAAAKTDFGAEVASVSRAAWRAARFTVIVWGLAALALF